MRYLGRIIGLVLAVAALAVVVLVWVNQRSVPANLTEPFLVTATGELYQSQGRVAQATARDGYQEVRVPLVNPKTSTEAVYTDLELQFSQDPAPLTVQAVSIQGDAVFTSEQTDSRTLVLHVQNAVPDSYTIAVLHAPAGYFTIPFLTRFSAAIVQAPLLGWLAVTGLLLLVVWLLLRYRTRTMRWKGQGMRPDVPAELSLIEVALLHHASVRPIDLVATLYQLAQRRYLDIIEQDTTVLFVRTKKSEGLLQYERNLMLLLFPNETTVPTSLQDVLKGINEELFSAVVSQIYVEIYDGFTEKDYFTDNPRFVHLRYKTTGIFVQLIGVLVAVGGYAFFHSVPGFLIFGLGIYLSGYLTYEAAYHILPFAPLSKVILSQLAQFITYLRVPTPIGPEGRQGYLFYAYVPYALVTDSALEWRARFSGIRWYIPDWYEYSEGQIVDPDSFTSRIEQVAAEIGAAMANVKDPNVD